MRRGPGGDPIHPTPWDLEPGRRRGEPSSPRGPPARGSDAVRPCTRPALPHLSSSPGHYPLRGARGANPRSDPARPLARLTHGACRVPLRSPLSVRRRCVPAARAPECPRRAGSQGRAPRSPPPPRPARCARAQDGCGRRPRPGALSASHSPRRAPRAPLRVAQTRGGGAFCPLPAPLPLTIVKAFPSWLPVPCPRRTLSNLIQLLIADARCELPAPQQTEGNQESGKEPGGPAATGEVLGRSGMGLPRGQVIFFRPCAGPRPGSENPGAWSGRIQPLCLGARGQPALAFRFGQGHSVRTLYCSR